MPSPEILCLCLNCLCRRYNDRVELVGKGLRPAKILGDFGKEVFFGHSDDILAEGISQVIQGIAVRFCTHQASFSMRRRIFRRLLSYSVGFNPLCSCSSSPLAPSIIPRTI